MNEDNKKRRSAWRFREIFRLPDFPGGIAAIILMLVSEAGAFQTQATQPGAAYQRACTGGSGDTGIGDLQFLRLQHL